MKHVKKTGLLGVIVVGLGASIVALSGLAAREVGITSSSRTEIAAFSVASDVYYDIRVKLFWDDVYNLDLYVTEPSGEVVTPFSGPSSIGGEIGYYDSGDDDDDDGDTATVVGEWQEGDSGDDMRREEYRLYYGMGGEYSVEVRYPLYKYSPDLHAWVVVTLYEHSDDAIIIGWGPVYMGGSKVGKTWDAGSFLFTARPERRGGGHGCFIATAACGDANAPEVRILSKFRDRFLLTTRPGRAVVNLYYRVSPKLAVFLAPHPWLKTGVRIALFPAVGFAWVALEGGWATVMVLVLLPSVGVVWSVRRFRMRRQKLRERGCR